MEFSGELSDFIMRDVKQRYSHVKDYIHVTLIEVCALVFLCLPFNWELTYQLSFPFISGK